MSIRGHGRNRFEPDRGRIRGPASALAAVVVGSALLASCSSSGTTASGKVLLVGTYRDHAGKYSSIQAAVDAAQPGDWILVAPGD